MIVVCLQAAKLRLNAQKAAEARKKARTAAQAAMMNAGLFGSAFADDVIFVAGVRAYRNALHDPIIASMPHERYRPGEALALVEKAQTFGYPDARMQRCFGRELECALFAGKTDEVRRWVEVILRTAPSQDEATA